MKKFFALVPVLWFNLFSYSNAFDVWDSILNMTSSIWSWFSSLISAISSLSSSILSWLSYILSILQALWFWMTSLISWVWDLVVQILQGGVFVNVINAFSKLSVYIWWPATVFLVSLLLVIF